MAKLGHAGKALFKNIKRGLAGNNKGLSTGFDRFDKYTFGIQRKYMTTIAGDSGSGKSTYALYSYVYRALIENPTTPINILFLAFEQSADSLLAKLLSLHLYEQYGLILSYDNILSLSGTVLTMEEQEIIFDECKDWIASMETRLTIIDRPLSADGIYGATKGWSLKFGTLEKVKDDKGVEHLHYTPNKPDQYLIVIVDHLRLIYTPGSETIKSQIDKACDYLVTLRNMLSLTVVLVQQLNRNFKSMDRRTGGGGSYQMIQLNDFADSSSPVQNSELVIALFHPFREKLAKCEGYDITKLGDSVRIVQLLKNRYGQSDIAVGVNFFGKIGFWRELPKSEEISDYSQFTSLLGDVGDKKEKQSLIEFDAKDQVKEIKEKEEGFVWSF